ncbi:hypothetical protein RCO48_31970 [Peribacillus frigoritolerans]|nr:hypothetical protein [Peribacillus frigoritolerans]
MKKQYSTYFNKIVNELFDKGLIKKRYIPYNACHTYIDNAWGAVEDGLISSVEVGAITGNTEAVALAHYRKYKTKKYVEATYMISIGDISIEGDIIPNGNEIKELPQVQRGAGGCRSDECIKLDEDDTDYKCLVCKKFVTSITRTKNL